MDPRAAASASGRRLHRLADHIAAVAREPAAADVELEQAYQQRGRGPPLSVVAGHITPEEAAALQIEPSKLAAIAEQFAVDGYAIVTGLFDHTLLDQMSDKLDNDAAHQVAKRVLEDREDGSDSSGARDMRHLGNGLPRHAPWVYPEVVASPLVEQLAAALLGGSAFIRYYNGNTSLPDDPADPKGEQGLHMDGGGWSVSSQEEAREKKPAYFLRRFLINKKKKKQIICQDRLGTNGKKTPLRKKRIVSRRRTSTISPSRTRLSSCL
jgi:hypothetical protein